MSERIGVGGKNGLGIEAATRTISDLPLEMVSAQMIGYHSSLFFINHVIIKIDFFQIITRKGRKNTKPMENKFRLGGCTCQ